MKKLVAQHALILVAFLAATGLDAQQKSREFVSVTKEYLHNPDPADWLMLGGNMEHWSYSRLDQINRENVGSLHDRRPGRGIAARPQRADVSD